MSDLWGILACIGLVILAFSFIALSTMGIVILIEKIKDKKEIKK